jgi:ABC-2 type transport system permease protein
MSSALTQSQLAAAMLSAMMIIALFTLGLGEFAFDSGPARELSAHVSVWGQMNDFSAGVVDLRRLVFDATLVAVPSSPPCARWRRGGGDEGRGGARRA